MKSLWLPVAFALLFSVGCSELDQPGWMRDVVNDWNGENMKMSSDPIQGSPARSTRSKMTD
jgi:hypothetical protein